MNLIKIKNKLILNDRRRLMTKQKLKKSQLSLFHDNNELINQDLHTLYVNLLYYT